jgi:hypothetical protein
MFVIPNQRGSEIFNIIINIINIIIFIIINIINIIINKFEKQLLLLKKIINIIWRVKLKIIIIIINKFEKTIITIEKNHKFELKGTVYLDTDHCGLEKYDNIIVLVARHPRGVVWRFFVSLLDFLGVAT